MIQTNIKREKLTIKNIFLFVFLASFFISASNPSYGVYLTRVDYNPGEGEETQRTIVGILFNPTEHEKYMSFTKKQEIDNDDNFSEALLNFVDYGPLVGMIYISGIGTAENPTHGDKLNATKKAIKCLFESGKLSSSKGHRDVEIFYGISHQIIKQMEPKLQDKYFAEQRKFWLGISDGDSNIEFKL